jgi:hypothetical protein
MAAAPLGGGLGDKVGIVVRMLLMLLLMLLMRSVRVLNVKMLRLMNDAPVAGRAMAVMRRTILVVMFHALGGAFRAA